MLASCSRMAMIRCHTMGAPDPVFEPVLLNGLVGIPVSSVPENSISGLGNSSPETSLLESHTTAIES